jgi:hypothetical protein
MSAGMGKQPENAPLCDLCRTPMLDIHCKLVCLVCGFQLDCSDP